MNAAAAAVAALRDRVDAMEADWRRRHLPPPSRERPRPDPAALEGARRLEAAGRELDAIAAQLRVLPGLSGGTAATGLAEADDAVRAHAGFLLDLLGTEPAVTPAELEREVEVLRELASRRLGGLRAGQE